VQAVRSNGAGRARRLSNARLAVFGIGLVLLWFVYGAERLPGVWMLAPIAVFAALVWLHDQALRRHDRAERAVAYYQEALARLEYRFAGRGESGESLRQPDHPYADDLDLFGNGSLFELLCRARTPSGQARLASWLQMPATLPDLAARHAAIAELRSMHDLRESLSLVGDARAAEIEPERLARWGAEAPAAPPALLRGFAAGMVGVTVALGVAWWHGMPLFGWLLWWSVQSGFALVLRGRVQRCARAVEAQGTRLEALSELLALLESIPAQSAPLAALKRLVETDGVTASRSIARLRTLRELLDARRNQFFAPIGALLLFTTQVALAIDAWRARHGPSLATWLDAVAEFEALTSLATHAAEHPDDPFPELRDGPPGFAGEGLGHPLIADDRSVRNDVRLDGPLRVLLVSGSNMSGKSTLLRTVGCNAVLALAGAPVRASRLSLTPLALGASIRIVDSLQQGHSKFYAEIRRLREIVELTAGPLPVLFLLDEILHGTNSHDRRIGAEAVVRTLVERGALGLVTTHDLALTRLGDDLGERAANVHFVDHLENGELRFDYRMRPGVVEKSNALALMRAVGLDV